MLSKRKKESLGKYDIEKMHSIDEACSVLKEITSSIKFDESIDLSIRLGVDPKKPNQMVRGVVSLPHGTGKDVKVLVICESDKNSDADKSGADFVGLEDYLDKIKSGWLDFDVLITTPSCMPKIGILGRFLGPRGLMPNPKSGTVTNDVVKAVKDVKSGKIDFKVDKFGIIHASFGKVSFSKDKMAENLKELLQTILKLKPNTLKGVYVRSVAISSTMSPGIKIDPNKI